ncbi:MAG: NADH-quinone oxidoreductase subunit A [Candidatus Odinarchaeota archaeon]
MQFDWLANIQGVGWFLAAFGVILLIVLLLYWIGKRIAPSNPTKEKTTTYACGEDLPAVKTQFHTQLLRYAVYFTIFDIVAFVLATSMGVLGWVPLIYLLVAFVAILILKK